MGYSPQARHDPNATPQSGVALHYCSAKKADAAEVQFAASTSLSALHSAGKKSAYAVGIVPHQAWRTMNCFYLLRLGDGPVHLNNQLSKISHFAFPLVGGDLPNRKPGIGDLKVLTHTTAEPVHTAVNPLLRRRLRERDENV